MLSMPVTYMPAIYMPVIYMPAIYMHVIYMPVTYVISDHDLICHILADCYSGALYIDYHIAGYL